LPAQKVAWRHAIRLPGGTREPRARNMVAIQALDRDGDRFPIHRRGVTGVTALVFGATEDDDQTRRVTFLWAEEA
jgi:hypothetical protein